MDSGADDDSLRTAIEETVRLKPKGHHILVRKLEQRMRDSIGIKLEIGGMGKVVAVCVSKEKSTRKTNVGAAKLLRDWGLRTAPMEGGWHRAGFLSLSFEKTEEFHQKARKFLTARLERIY